MNRSLETIPLSYRFSKQKFIDNLLIKFLILIGKGSFGEIFLASDDTLHPVTNGNAKFVVKIEPHKSGPLFVEIHCLMKAGKDTGTLEEIQLSCTVPCS